MIMNKNLQVRQLHYIIASLAVMWQTILTQDQEINIQNMNVELAAQMFKNYRSNVLFHLEGQIAMLGSRCL